MSVIKSRFEPAPFVISLVITLGIGGVASFFTVPQIEGWYVHLQKPVFDPPNWIFAPVWTMLYIMIAVAAYTVWQRRRETPGYIKAKGIYIIQLFLNFSWSIVFFGLHQILAALIVIVLLFFSIIINISFFRKISNVAGWLLLPYLLWVSFAAVLNFSIYILNN